MARRTPRRRQLLTTWSGSLHKSFRILPTEQFSNEDLLAFINGNEGDSRADVHARLPYDRSRSRRASAADDEGDDEEDEEEGDDTSSGPDSKRYRDPRQVFENCGLLWEDDSQRIRFTDLGRTLKRFMPHANEKNVALIAQHAALGLNVCQLRNPTRAGQRFHADMRVFPFRFIWQAMLKLDNRINSEELNRAIFATRNAEMLPEAIERIHTYRQKGNADDLGAETVQGRTPSKKNDRIIPIVCLASFGWTLINQKDADSYYTIKPDCVQFLRSAVNVPVQHRDFDSVEDYVKRISRAACLPKDVR